MKKTLILICVILIISSSSVVSTMNKTEFNLKSFNHLNYNNDDDIVLDQCQNDSYGTYGFRCEGSFAQCFVPTKPVLSKIELRMFYKGIIPAYLEISIRDDLYGDDLRKVDFNSEDYGHIDWYKIDFNDLSVIPNEPYYIIWETSGSANNDFFWCYGLNNPYEKGDPYHGESLFLNYVWEKFIPDGYPGLDFCFRTWGCDELIYKPDLYCEGSLNFNRVQPNRNLTGKFLVENRGHENSSLSWEIIDYPDWGNWTFKPKEGDNLKTTQGPIAVVVSVISPDVNNEDFSGRITIRNKYDYEDIEYVDIGLSTVKNVNNMNKISNFNLFNIFKNIYLHTAKIINLIY